MTKPTLSQLTTEVAALTAANQTLTAAVQQHEQQVSYLLVQVQNLYNRLQLAPLDVTKTTNERDTRSETGLGPILNVGHSPYL